MSILCYLSTKNSNFYCLNLIWNLFKTSSVVTMKNSFCNEALTDMDFYDQRKKKSFSLQCTGSLLANYLKDQVHRLALNSVLVVTVWTIYCTDNHVYLSVVDTRNLIKARYCTLTCHLQALIITLNNFWFLLNITDVCLLPQQIVN